MLHSLLITTSNSVVPQPLCVLVVEFHQATSHVMFQREEMVVPEHQTGHVNLEKKPVSFVFGILSVDLKLALASSCKSYSTSYQILLCWCSHWKTESVFKPIVNSWSWPSGAKYVRHDQVDSSDTFWLVKCLSKPAGTKCVRGGSSSSVGRTAPTSGLASRQTSLRRKVYEKMPSQLDVAPWWI